MAEHQIKKLQYDGKDVYAEVANRDSSGNIISDSFELKQNNLTIAGSSLIIPVGTNEVEQFLTNNNVPLPTAIGTSFLCCTVDAEGNRTYTWKTIVLSDI